MMTHGSESQKGVDNPQMARLKQHFEKKNRRHTNELEHLQKKLANYEQRLAEIESGVPDSEELPLCRRWGTGLGIIFRVRCSTSTSVFFARRTGANLKGMTETVIAAPLELAHRLKNTFGSADNVSDLNEGTNSDLKIGQSKFYASSDFESPQQTVSRFIPSLNGFYLILFVPWKR
ncbi:hypothetical protein DICVIV_12366 [Dictyocaulus viviparus]|uniref:Uncharacterized protein n=1 Tax=Dictyocaulus viviparus TaxID=29172 RepID=A0A0D8XCZ2_DICVI|nr:hypothetical protein DICVIV_12366 [Dictyocaulus viviparus]